MKKDHRFSKLFGAPMLAAFYMLCPIAAFYLLEMLTHNPFVDIHLGLHLFSWLLYLLFYTVCFLIIGRMSGAFCLATFLVAVVGMINYYTISFRGSPLLPWDIHSIGTAISVADNQTFHLPPKIIAILCGFALLMILSLFCRLRLPSAKKRLTGAAASIVLLTVLGLSLQTDWAANALDIYEMPFTQGYTYRQNGFLVSYLMNAKYLSVDKPASYDVSSLEETAATDDERVPSTVIREQKPNIIVIMNEAFSDLSVLGDFDTNKDYMPYFRSVTDNAISGSLYVSVLGGNTANSEFEFLTGDSMAFLPTGSIPYQQYIRSELPSLVNVLKKQGYYSVAMHPYYASGWERDSVYDYLGFDEKHFLSDFGSAERLRQYVSDWGMYERVISLYEQKEAGQPLFLFGVTMQNHSGYSKEFENFSNDVNVLNGDYHNADTYLSLVAQSDRSYEKLIRYFSQADEPTIVVMFGDHQPTSLEGSFFREVLGNDPQTLSLEETALRYQTPFKIWANYDIEEADGMEISTNYLGTLLMQTAGLELSDYQEYLWTIHEKLPVITANFYKDADGNLYACNDASDRSDEPSDAVDGGEIPASYQNLLDDYASLQYNHLFDEANRVMSLFSIEEGQAS